HVTADAVEDPPSVGGRSGVEIWEKPMLGKYHLGIDEPGEPELSGQPAHPKLGPHLLAGVERTLRPEPTQHRRPSRRAGPVSALPGENWACLRSGLVCVREFRIRNRQRPEKRSVTVELIRPRKPGAGALTAVGAGPGPPHRTGGYAGGAA